jgi:hypothetical protein
MPRRKKPVDTLPLAPGPAPAPPPADAATAAPESAPPTNGTPAPPDFEARLKILEARLTESDRIIRQQASAIAIGVENAERLRKSRERVDRLEKEADEAKKQAGDAKKRYEAEVKAHFELEIDLDSPQGKLPFPADPDQDQPDVNAELVAGVSEAEAAKDAAWLAEAPPVRVWIVRRVKTGEYLGRVTGVDLDRARAAAEGRWSHLDRKAIEVHPALREDEMETTGEYDLDGALRAGEGPRLPGAAATEGDKGEDEGDEERHPWVTGADDLRPEDDGRYPDEPEDYDDPADGP